MKLLFLIPSLFIILSCGPDKEKAKNVISDYLKKDYEERAAEEKREFEFLEILEFDLTSSNINEFDGRRISSVKEQRTYWEQRLRTVQPQKEGDTIMDVLFEIAGDTTYRFHSKEREAIRLRKFGIYKQKVQDCEWRIDSLNNTIASRVSPPQDIYKAKCKYSLRWWGEDGIVADTNTFFLTKDLALLLGEPLYVPNIE